MYLNRRVGAAAIINPLGIGTARFYSLSGVWKIRRQCMRLTCFRGRSARSLQPLGPTTLPSGVPDFRGTPFALLRIRSKPFSPRPLSNLRAPRSAGVVRGATVLSLVIFEPHCLFNELTQGFGFWSPKGWIFKLNRPGADTLRSGALSLAVPKAAPPGSKCSCPGDDCLNLGRKIPIKGGSATLMPSHDLRLGAWNLPISSTVYLELEEVSQ